MTHSGGSNFAVWVKDSASGRNVDLAANTIGPYDGSAATVLRQGGRFFLDVSADGAWTVEIKRPTNLEARQPGEFSGSGPQVIVLELPQGRVNVTGSHSGRGNFAVWMYGASSDLLFNEIGDFEGRQSFSATRAGSYVLAIDADGPWTISVIRP